MTRPAPQIFDGAGGSQDALARADDGAGFAFPAHGTDEMDHYLQKYLDYA